jgi:hypothetical protein
MKKNLAISALVIASVLAFAGCSKNVEENVDVNAEETVEAVEATENTEAVVEETEAVAEEVAESTEATENVEATEAAATLEEYFAAHEDELAALTQMAEANEGLDIAVVENTINYTYTIEVAEDAKEATVAAITEQFNTESTVNATVSSVKMTESGAGIEGVNFVYTYVNADGEELCHFTFNNEGLVVEE